ncbi:MAG: GNAT family N-acetyltransferase [Pseudomonadota bacterium]
MTADIKIRWIDDAATASEGAELLVGAALPAYISHSELMWGRAVAPGVWSNDIRERVAAEFLTMVGQHDPSEGHSRLLGAFAKGTLIGVMACRFEIESDAPHAVLDDVAVRSDYRGQGVMRAMLAFFSDAARALDLERMFLESGRSNEGAHHAFEELGFAPISVTMMKDL